MRSVKQIPAYWRALAAIAMVIAIVAVLGLMLGDNRGERRVEDPTALPVIPTPELRQGDDGILEAFPELFRPGESIPPGSDDEAFRYQFRFVLSECPEGEIILSVGFDRAFMDSIGGSSSEAKARLAQALDGYYRELVGSLSKEEQREVCEEAKARKSPPLVERRNPWIRWG
ncbi:MAG: hypothetical protein WD850_02360 [Candidatus Spechtbacterales bacterium]